MSRPRTYRKAPAVISPTSPRCYVSRDLGDLISEISSRRSHLGAYSASGSSPMAAAASAGGSAAPTPPRALEPSARFFARPVCRDGGSAGERAVCWLCPRLSPEWPPAILGRGLHMGVTWLCPRLSPEWPPDRGKVQGRFREGSGRLSPEWPPDRGAPASPERGETPSASTCHTRGD